MSKIKLERYCNNCESSFTCFIESEGVKYKHANHCPVCGDDNSISITEDETKYDISEFEK